MQKFLSGLDKLILISAAALPFFMAVAPGPMNVFAALLIISFLLKKIIKHERLFFPGLLGLSLIMFFLVTCLSIIHSLKFIDTLKGGIFRLFTYILVFLAMAHEAKDKRFLKWIIISSGCGLALVSIDGIWQVATGKDFIRGYEPVLNIGLARATASFKDSNVMGIYLSALSPLGLGLSLYYFKGKNKMIMAALSILSLIGVVLTYSRPTLLAVYIALLFLAIVKKDKLIIGGLVLVTLISPFAMPRSVKDWARGLEYNPLRIMCNDDRIAIYRNTLRMIKAHPIIGVGANTFMKNYRFYKEYPEYRNVVTIDYIYAHNNFLHMAGELGLAGLSLFLWFVYLLFKRGLAIHKRLKDGFSKTLSLSLLACIIAFLVNGLTESSLYYSRVAVLFWYIAGLVLALDKFQTRGEYRSTASTAGLEGVLDDAK
ncbi:MAG: O-antigen ligase family protein [Candidatus Omnitrophica bacterium]|nr:O-antigen ligase family protein [Candidatus Omnitrophota bacterium]